MTENNSIYTPTKWSCRKNEQVGDGEGEEYAQWCRTWTGIMGSSCRHCMLLEEQVTHINTSQQDSL